MPIICIGPVCIPITAIIPILLFVFKPIYNRLPEKQQKKIDYGILQCQLALNRCLKNVGWNRKKQKSKNNTNEEINKSNEGNQENQPKQTQETHDLSDKDSDKSSKEKQNEKVTNEGHNELIPQLQSEEEWDKLLETTPYLLAYFTSQWCKPCKLFYPKLEALAQETKDKLRFIKVDIDDFDEISLENRVAALPSFILFKNGKSIGCVKGPKEEDLKTLMTV